MKRKFTNEEEQEIRKIYKVGRKSSYEIARAYSGNPQTVLDAIRRAGGKIRSESVAQKLRYLRDPHPKRIFTEEEELEIRKIYEVGKATATRIATAYRRGRDTIQRALLRAGGRIRTTSEELFLRYPNAVCHRNGPYPAIHILRLAPQIRKMVEPMTNVGGRITMHRLVMACHLRRPLTSKEIVHHRGGDKKNYRLSNLELLTQAKHPSGHGDPYYQAWQEVLAENRKLRAILGKCARRKRRIKGE